MEMVKAFLMQGFWGRSTMRRRILENVVQVGRQGSGEEKIGILEVPNLEAGQEQWGSFLIGFESLKPCWRKSLQNFPFHSGPFRYMDINKKLIEVSTLCR